MGLAGSASAAGNPPWEPDPTPSAASMFYNADGNQVTGGNVTDKPIAAYVEGAATVRAGDTKATLYGYLPVNGVPSARGAARRSAPRRPTRMPARLAHSRRPRCRLRPVAPATSASPTWISDFPNTDTTSRRLRRALPAAAEDHRRRPAGRRLKYDSADIQITGTGASATWAVVYPRRDVDLDDHHSRCEPGQPAAGGHEPLP